METLPSQLTGRARAARRAGLLLLALLCAPGCTLDKAFVSGNADAPPRPGHATQLATAWVNRVQYTADVANDGKAAAGLVCRMYLFDEQIKDTLVGDGTVLITLFDDTKGPATQPLEQWQIDPVALKKFLKKDMVGWGYTLFLPWGSCRPDVTKVHLTCRYDPIGGKPLFGPVTPLTIEHTPAPDGLAGALMSPPPPTAPPAKLPQQLGMPTPVR
jgi:hypothetical protein